MIARGDILRYAYFHESIKLYISCADWVTRSRSKKKYIYIHYFFARYAPIQHNFWLCHTPTIKKKKLIFALLWKISFYLLAHFLFNFVSLDSLSCTAPQRHSPPPSCSVLGECQWVVSRSPSRPSSYFSTRNLGEIGERFCRGSPLEGERAANRQLTVQVLG